LLFFLNNLLILLYFILILRFFFTQLLLSPKLIFYFSLLTHFLHLFEYRCKTIFMLILLLRFKLSFFFFVILWGLLLFSFIWADRCYQCNKFSELLDFNIYLSKFISHRQLLFLFECILVGLHKSIKFIIWLIVILILACWYLSRLNLFCES